MYIFFQFITPFLNTKLKITITNTSLHYPIISEKTKHHYQPDIANFLLSKCPQFSTFFIDRYNIKSCLILAFMSPLKNN